MARWDGDKLVHGWFGSVTEDVVATWDGDGSLWYESIDDSVRFRFYEKPSAQDAIDRIVRYQCG